MRINNIRAIKQFIDEHPDSESGLKFFTETVRAIEWSNPAQVRSTFPSADYLGANKWIFNVSGNNFRVAAMVWINNGVVHVLKVMTHAEYDREQF
jgi:mRNA interferase HigB